LLNQTVRYIVARGVLGQVIIAIPGRAFDCALSALLADPPIAAVLADEILGDADLRQAQQFGERRVRPAAATRQLWNERGHLRVAVPIERPQVDVADSAAGGAARPKEPIAGRDGGTDGRREQHRHPLGLTLIPGDHQPLGVLEDLAIRRAAHSRFVYWVQLGSGGSKVAKAFTDNISRSA
jgi:hypothetical protein